MKKEFAVLVLMTMIRGLIGAQEISCIFQEDSPAFRYDTCSSTKASIEYYFRSNYKMPEILLDNGYVGSIYIEAVIEKDGSMKHIKIVRGVDPPLDSSVMETVKLMPRWIPARRKDKIVSTRITFRIPVHWLYGRTDVF
ncbi:MAG TPA: energy transducer TonB [Bacteroidales bacterium]|nr:energy transducer TonB [Bacteroidales bacterium]